MSSNDAFTDSSGLKWLKTDRAVIQNCIFWWFLIQLGRIWDKIRPSCITEQSFDEAPCPANTAADHSIKCLQTQPEGLRTLDCACRKNCIRITDQFTDRLLHRNWHLYMSIHILLQLKLPYLERFVDGNAQSRLRSSAEGLWSLLWAAGLRIFRQRCAMPGW